MSYEWMKRKQVYFKDNDEVYVIEFVLCVEIVYVLVIYK